MPTDAIESQKLETLETNPQDEIQDRQKIHFRLPSPKNTALVDELTRQNNNKVEQNQEHKDAFHGRSMSKAGSKIVRQVMLGRQINNIKRISTIGRPSINLGNPEGTLIPQKSISQSSIISNKPKGTGFLINLLSVMEDDKNENGKQIGGHKREIKQFNIKIERVDRVKGYIIKYPFLIIPAQSKFKLYWDLGILLCIFWILLYLPWEIAFPDDNVPVMENFILVIFVMDVVLTFRTSYYNSEFEEIVSQKLIALNYIRSPTFILDILSAFPFDFVLVEDSNSSFVGLFKFIKIVRLLRIGKLMKLINNESFKLAQDLFKYFFGFLLIVHWFTLLFYTMAASQAEDINDCIFNNTWMPSTFRIITQSSKLDADIVAKSFIRGLGYSKGEQYIYSFYSIIMIILGGEISPVTASQSIFAATCVLLGQLTIAIIYANMSVIMFKLNWKKALYENTLNDLESLLHQNSIPKNIKNKIFEYFEYCWRKNVIFDRDLTDFSNLSLTLRREVLVCIHKEIILKVPLFSDLEQYEVLSIIQKLKTRVFMPGEVIYKENELVNEMYFIDEGIVELVKKDEDGAFDKFLLSNGDHFGEMAILQHWRSDLDAYSLIFSIVEVFSRKDYEALKKEYPDIEKRLKVGLRIYKREDKNRIVDKVKDAPIFEGLSEYEIGDLYINYMQDVFLDPDTIIIVPREMLNAIYFILKGTVDIYDEVEAASSAFVEDDIYTQCIDDQIYDYTDIKSHENIQKLLKGSVRHLGKLKYGNYFGLIPLKENEMQFGNDNLYLITETSCHFNVMTFNVLRQIEQNRPDMYQQLIQNIKTMQYVINPNILDSFEQERCKYQKQFYQSPLRLHNNLERKRKRSQNIEFKLCQVMSTMEQNMKKMIQFQRKIRRLTAK